MKTIIFDLGEVLFRGFYGVGVLISQKLGSNVTNKSLQTPELYSFYRGEMKEEEMWQRMIERFEWPLTFQDLQALIRQNFAEIPGTIDIVGKLKLMGCYNLALLSVHGREWIEYLRGVYGYEELFDCISYSFLIHVCKPDPFAFHSVIEQLSCSPRDCLVIDDFETNIDVALQLGFHTHTFISAERLQTDLIKKGYLDP